MYIWGGRDLFNHGHIRGCGIANYSDVSADECIRFEPYRSDSLSTFTRRAAIRAVILRVGLHSSADGELLK